MISTDEKPRHETRALLVGVHWKNNGATSEEDAASLLEELGELVDTLGMPVVDRVLARVPGPQARFIVGSGKAEEIAARARLTNADVIVFDNALTPGQQRNWEELTKLAVIDREEVILEIFAARAQTREARLQVALARMEYSLPRLARAWGHLSRQQGGGLGGKGEGESQLETDRRLVRKRIDRLKAELVEVRSQRATQRKQRQRVPLPQAAIIGYTNAGKSSLLRALTGAGVLVEDKLFATLDPTTRQLQLPAGQQMLLTDTVGFVRNLPHRIVEAFKATLEEALLADFLIHVLDVTQPEVYAFHRTTMNVLAELGAGDKTILTVFNKIDLLPEHDRSALLPLRRQFDGSLFISTRTGEGLDELVHRLEELLADRIRRVELRLPSERGELLAELHRRGHVIAVEPAADGLSLRVFATLPPKALPTFAPFCVEPAGVVPVRAGSGGEPSGPVPATTPSAAVLGA